MEIEEFLEVSSVAALLLLKSLAGKSGKDASSPPRVHPKRYASTRVHRDHISPIYLVAIYCALWHWPLPYSGGELYETSSLQPTKRNAAKDTRFPTVSGRRACRVTFSNSLSARFDARLTNGERELRVDEYVRAPCFFRVTFVSSGRPSVWRLAQGRWMLGRLVRRCLTLNRAPSSLMLLPLGLSRW
jgi:hypothetical protein